MARMIKIELVDDLDGGAADESISFALDGVEYTIDLNEKNAQEMRHALAKYVEVAKRDGGRKKRKRAARTGRTGRGDLEDIRSWGRENGYAVADRGRLSAELMSAYDAANGAGSED